MSEHENENKNDSEKRHVVEPPRLLVTPIRLLIKLMVRLAPERYKERIRKGGKKMTTHGFADAAVILTFLTEIGQAVVLIVALVGLGLFFSMMEE